MCAAAAAFPYYDAWPAVVLIVGSLHAPPTMLGVDPRTT